MIEFRDGDTVRVSYETTVSQPSLNRSNGEVRVNHANGEDGTFAYVPADALTLVKRADDPENDPVGTVRQHLSSRYIKIRRGIWVSIRDRDVVYLDDVVPFSNHDMVGMEKVGSVDLGP